MFWKNKNFHDLKVYIDIYFIITSFDQPWNGWDIKCSLFSSVHLPVLPPELFRLSHDMLANIELLSLVHVYIYGTWLTLWRTRIFHTYADNCTFISSTVLTLGFYIFPFFPVKLLPYILKLLYRLNLENIFVCLCHDHSGIGVIKIRSFEHYFSV